jgi:predicted O-methyltransferase YrrM
MTKAEKVWQAVDTYYSELFGLTDPVMKHVLAASDADGLPAIQVSPLQGRLLMMLAQLSGASRILEIGTLGGYSTIWLARALPPEGRLVTLEFEPRHAKVAKANLAYAGFSEQVEVRLGKAADSLAGMIGAGEAPFDLIFIDADKPGYPAYLEASLQLVRPGGLIIADNMVRDGAVADAQSRDASVRAVRQFNEIVAKDTRLCATAIQTVGEKGYDGFVLVRVPN